MTRGPRRRRRSGNRAAVAAVVGCVAATEGAKVAAGLTATPTPAQAGLLVVVVAMSGLLAWLASPGRQPAPVAAKKCQFC